MKGVLEAGDRKVCMPKTKTCLQGPKKAGEAAGQRRWSRPAQVRPCGHDKDLDLHPGLSREKAVAVGNGWREHMGAWETRWEVHYKEASR